MPALRALIATLAAGVGLGLALTHVTTGSDPPVGAVRLGPWTAWPGLADPGADAYSRAWLARSGTLPLERGEGVALMARTDSDGQPLDGACRYAVGPVTVPVRLWTLALGDAVSSAQGLDGIGRPADRPVRVGPGGELVPAGRFALTLRLYGLPVAARTLGRTPPPLPPIRREGCP